MTDKYVLEADNQTPRPASSMEWAAWYLTVGDGRVVAKDTVGDVKVSTVFLALDHRFGSSGDPVLWETMIFGGPHDGYQERYTSYADAVQGHKVALAMVRE